MSSPLRESETLHENMKEELLNIKPADGTIAEPVLDQTEQEKTKDMVGFQVVCTGFARFPSVILFYKKGQKLDLEHIKTTIVRCSLNYNPFSDSSRRRGFTKRPGSSHHWPAPQRGNS